MYPYSLEYKFVNSHALQPSAERKHVYSRIKCVCAIGLVGCPGAPRGGAPGLLSRTGDSVRRTVVVVFDFHGVRERFQEAFLVGHLVAVNIVVKRLTRSAPTAHQVVALRRNREEDSGEKERVSEDRLGNRLLVLVVLALVPPFGDEFRDEGEGNADGDCQADSVPVHDWLLPVGATSCSPQHSQHTIAVNTLTQLANEQTLFHWRLSL